ncbi:MULTISPECIES: L-aspartate oxidase [Reichenbachiella]|uniref:L-aspartate oxidase n=1 Tax=Reichenbachiella agariperforans TaxID=156994 RepID=A0A1M6N4U8_REIAG|nr:MULTISPECIES: L-aspartate oxidase [Reichenbachiella]MBU2915729.1 L-aspartate oxidase [Reichenbachiella agariperforans]RJE72003.1 L-aspartate oxidase [Reichenbachiella sp. MSK19-1]SHJ90749.1 L-aspartate oxidase [Reichenbachiella agariperforans]
MPHYDYLVIGSGIAGLTYALKIAKECPDKRLAMITKSYESESNTKYAQGGMAVVMDKVLDSYDQHIKDTLIAGDGLCDEAVVEFVVREAPVRLKELIAWGTKFDKGKHGKYDLGKEGGHSANRILHHKDITGYEIQRALLEQVHRCKNVEILPHHFAMDLITEHHLDEGAAGKSRTCFGAYVLNEKTKSIESFTSKITMLASGGIGHVYQNTTNPKVATGDGVAMAYRAKAKVSHMEFVQFHPTALYEPERKGQTFLISEAVRGFGGMLRDKNGESFMQHYDERQELASRDIVSRAIDAELKRSGDEYVYLDCRHLDIEEFEKHFPNITNKCRSIGIDIEHDMIPVVPAAHYLCGGIEVDHSGLSCVGNLFVVGESACTGLHGANRLASNSLLEAIVYAHRSYQKSLDIFDQITYMPTPRDWSDKGTTDPKELILITHNRKEVQAIMSNYVGIIRSTQRLDRANKRLKLLYDETEELYKKSKISPQLSELRNLITVSYLIIQQSLKRDENRGGFFRTS